jgi:hypothetical protein
MGSCTLHKNTTGIHIKNQETVQNDSTEYELIIFDPGFESWFITHSHPVWYYSQDYFENWNQQYVTAWNAKVMTPRYSRYFESTIDWDPFTDYGLELNHKLFYYFQYVERMLKIEILPSGSGPQTVF